MIIDFAKNLKHEVAEVICLKCLTRWIAVYPAETRLCNLECRCGEMGYVIKTGQTLLGAMCVVAGICGAVLAYANEKDNYIIYKEIADDKPRETEDIGQTNIRSIRFRE